MSSDTQTNSEMVLQFKAHYENGVIVPEENVSIPTGKPFLVTLQFEPTSEIDALAEIAKLAQPLGPANLARDFDVITGRVTSDESAQ